MHLRAPFEAVLPLKWYHMQLEIDILEGHCRAEGITAFHLRNKRLTVHVALEDILVAISLKERTMSR
jgi:hypothetical protein